MNLLVTSTSFSQKPREKIQRLKDFNVIYNKKGRSYSKKEIIGLLKMYDPIGIIAGTEKYDADVLSYCKNLKVISRVGVGLDSINLLECKKRRILVKNTPSAPTNAVAEMVIGQMINLARRMQESNNNLKRKIWEKHIGKEIRNSAIGIIGCGRIGSSVFYKLLGFKPKQIIVNDILVKKAKALKKGKFASKEKIVKNCDVITIHIPLNKKNKNYITKKELDLMKKDVILLNFSRGGIINEKDLYNWLKKNPEAGVALDTFENEPYKGKLIKLSNCYLTPHMGSYSGKSRLDMEIKAVNNLIKFLPI